MGYTNYRKTARLLIDKERLRGALKKRGLTNADVQRELGCGNAIQDGLVRGVLSKPIIMLLESVYGIAYEEIKPQELCGESVPAKDEYDKMQRAAVEAIDELVKGLEAAKAAIENALI